MYEELSGWQSSTHGMRDYAALPSKAREYVERLADLIGVPFSLVVHRAGPRRDHPGQRLGPHALVPRPPERASRALRPSGGMALKILIVDDEEPARQGLTALLARWGYDVDEAGDGQEALAKAAAGLPAVVVSDLVMPKMDGLELLRALKTRRPVHLGDPPDRAGLRRHRGGPRCGRAPTTT